MCIRRTFLLIVVLTVLAAVASAHATEIRMVIDRPVDLSPGSLTAPVTLRFSASASDSCTSFGSCRTRSAIAISISPCPPGATSCVGSQAIYFQNRDRVSIFDPMRFELDPNTQYSVSGEWTLEQYRDSGNGCSDRICQFTQSFGQTFFLSELVEVLPLGWSALKSQW